MEQDLLSQNMSLKHVIVQYSATKNKGMRTFNRTIFTRSPVNDMVSKNITLVLENLLKDYESSQLPTHGKGKLLKFLTNHSIFVNLQENIGALKIVQM